jgi:Domain of unknown function (DUF4337)
MDIEVSAEAKDKRLNRLIAVTVVTLSVVMGLCNIKDGNIVQAMQYAKADAVDTWGEYQATKTKLHIAQTAGNELQIIAASANDAGQKMASVQMDRLSAKAAKYQVETPRLAAKAKGFEAQYDALNVHDDQFDASDAMISTAISMAAVAALIESFGLLYCAWAFGVFGIFMGLCGFAGWAFHPDILSNFLG